VVVDKEADVEKEVEANKDAPIEREQVQTTGVVETEQGGKKKD